jgi:hypothetical protein
MKRILLSTFVVLTVLCSNSFSVQALKNRRHGQNNKRVLPTCMPNTCCTPPNLVGWWGFILTGTTGSKPSQTYPPDRRNPLRPLALVGRENFLADGTVILNFTLNHNGVAAAGITVNGTYTIDENCMTGSINTQGYLNNALINFKTNFVVVNGGRELYFIMAEPACPPDGPPADCLPTNPADPLPGLLWTGEAKRR